MEVSRLQSSNNRAGLDMDYLKNVIVGFLEDPSNTTLVDVLVRLLDFSLEERQRISDRRSRSFFGLW